MATALLATAALGDDAAPAAPGGDAAAPEPNDGTVGSPRPPGLHMAPEAPPVPPAAGGRAPSFGTPEKPSSWSFNLGGRISGVEAIGIGRKPANRPDGYDGRALHVPSNAAGRGPWGVGAGAGLNFQYGNPVVNAVVTFNLGMPGTQARGYYNPSAGSGLSQAYLVFRPDKMGPMQLSIKAGAFSENYAGPGQWGWGVYGPLLAVRGYGEAVTATVDASSDLRLDFAHGVFSVPGVPEAWARGDYTSWIETGVSTFVQHAHAGMTYEDKYVLKFHWARASGTDDRTYLAGPNNAPRWDGRIDNLDVETRWLPDPYGQLGLSAGYWNFNSAGSVGDGIWWGLDWTQGGREMTSKFLGPDSDSTGRIGAISAEYDTSIARIANPSFDGNGPDVRIAVAGIYDRTLKSADKSFKNANGYYVALDIEYRMLSWFGVTMQTYGESRDQTAGRWTAWSVNPGISFRSDWVSADRFIISYSRRFYSRIVDNNSAQPLDRDIIAFGGFASF